MTKKTDHKVEQDEKIEIEKSEEKETTTENVDPAVQLQKDLAESQDKFLRLYSEFDNYRKRTQRERLDLFKTAGEDIIKSLLPVLDDFERAKLIWEKSDNIIAFEGIALIYHKLNATLEQKGLKKMRSVGEQFNEELHEAISMVAANETQPAGSIIDEAECGYYLHDKVIRHAKVIVAQ